MLGLDYYDVESKWDLDYGLAKAYATEAAIRGAMRNRTLLVSVSMFIFNGSSLSISLNSQ